MMSPVRVRVGWVREGEEQRGGEEGRNTGEEYRGGAEAPEDTNRAGHVHVVINRLRVKVVINVPSVLHGTAPCMAELPAVALAAALALAPHAS